MFLPARRVYAADTHSGQKFALHLIPKCQAPDYIDRNITVYNGSLIDMVCTPASSRKWVFP